MSTTHGHPVTGNRPHVELPSPAEQRRRMAAVSALLAEWDAEDAGHPDQAAAEWAELRDGLQANRKGTGERPLFRDDDAEAEA